MVMNVLILFTKILTAVVSHWIFHILFFIGLILYAAHRNREEVTIKWKEAKDGAARVFKILRKEQK